MYYHFPMFLLIYLIFSNEHFNFLFELFVGTVIMATKRYQNSIISSSIIMHIHMYNIIILYRDNKKHYCKKNHKNVQTLLNFHEI